MTGRDAHPTKKTGRDAHPTKMTGRDAHPTKMTGRDAHPTKKTGRDARPTKVVQGFAQSSVARASTPGDLSFSGCSLGTREKDRL
jgi:hypothetical protein